MPSCRRQPGMEAARDRWNTKCQNMFLEGGVEEDNIIPKIIKHLEVDDIFTIAGEHFEDEFFEDYASAMRKWIQICEYILSGLTPEERIENFECIYGQPWIHNILWSLIEKIGHSEFQDLILEKWEDEGEDSSSEEEYTPPVKKKKTSQS